MKKYILGAALSLALLASPAFTQAAALTQTQINAIVSLLQSFGADQTTINNVQVSLNGGTPSNSLTIITDSQLPNAKVGQPYSVALNVSGGTGSYSWSVNNGVAAFPVLGLGISSSEGNPIYITGTPSKIYIAGVESTIANTFTFTVTVKSGSRKFSKQFTLTVDPATTVTTPSLTVTRGSGDPASNNILAGASQVMVGQFSFAAQNASYTVNKFSIGVTSGTSNSIASVTVQYKDVNGMTQTATVPLTIYSTGAMANFSNLSMYVPANSSASLSVYIGTPTIASGATSGAAIRVSIDGSTVSAVSSSGTTLNNVNSNMSVPATGTFYVRKSIPTFATLPQSTNTVPATGSPLYKFSVTADPAGDIEWTRLTFNIAVSDRVNVSNVYLVDEASGANLLDNPLSLSAAGRVTVDLTNNTTNSGYQQVAAGSAKTYGLHGTVTGFTTGSALSISLVPDTSPATNAPNFVPGNTVWSDRSSFNHSITSPDWTNGYLLKDFDGSVKYSFGTTTTPSITVLSPNGGETLTAGKTYIGSFLWNGFIPKNIKATLINSVIGSSDLTDLGAISVATAGDKSFSFTIPSSKQPSSNYKINVCDIGSPEYICDASDAPFSIVAVGTPPQPSITVLSPNGGEVFQVGKTYSIQWNSVEIPSDSSVTIGLRDMRYEDGPGPLGSASIAQVANSGAYSWTVPQNLGNGGMVLGAGNFYKVWIDSYYNRTQPGAWEGISTNTFSITSTQSTTPVTLSSITPASGPVGTSVRLDGCGSDSSKGFALVYTGPKKGAMSIPVETLGAASGCGYLTFTIPPLPIGTYAFSVKNKQTGVMSTNTKTFTVITAPSTVSVSNPGLAGALGAFDGTGETASNPTAQNTSGFNYTWTRDLQIGSPYQGDVIALQQALTREGVYAGELTGGFYNQTYWAVQAFQRKYGINATGYVGLITRAKLNTLY